MCRYARAWHDMARPPLRPIWARDLTLFFKWLFHSIFFFFLQHNSSEFLGEKYWSNSRTIFMYRFFFCGIFREVLITESSIFPSCVHCMELTKPRLTCLSCRLTSFNQGVIGIFTRQQPLYWPPFCVFSQTRLLGRVVGWVNRSILGFFFSYWLIAKELRPRIKLPSRTRAAPKQPWFCSILANIYDPFAYSFSNLIKKNII